MNPASARRVPGNSKILLTFILLGLAGSAIWYFTRERPIEVELRAVEIGRVESSVANTRAGTVKALRRAKLAPSAGGQVVKLLVREGDSIKEGDLLLELWNEDLKAQIQLAESQAMAAQATAEEVCLQAAQARREADRQQRLLSDGIAAADVVESFQSEAEARQAACKAAQAVAKERAASIQVANAALDKTLLRAPFDGIVAKLNVELGEYVTPSPPGIPTPPAIDLIERGPLRVEAPIDEVDAPLVQKGQKARVTLDSFPGKIFQGTIQRVAPYVLDLEKQARTVDVVVELPEFIEGGLLLPGYSADVEIIIEARERVLRLPTESILDGRKVLVYRQGRLEERRIEVGLSNWQFTEVTAGLEAGEQVVIPLDREGVRAGARAEAKSPD